MDRSVALRDISIRYGNSRRPVMQHVSLDVGSNEFIVVVGMSGVGKSSLLRVISGLMKAEEGEVRIDVDRHDGSRPFGFVFQEPRLFPWRTVGRNVALGLEGLEISREDSRERVSRALRLVGLSEYAGRYPRQLSGGQKQRVGIARALAVEPALLLMDEPFSSLDAVTRRTLQEELLRIWHSTETSVLFVTHDVEEAVYLADRVVLLAGSPARGVEEYPIRSQRPRRTDDPDSQAIVRRIRDDLYSYQDDQII
jgi:NitT/TauT family transport system ATP-binding protein